MEPYAPKRSWTRPAAPKIASQYAAAPITTTAARMIQTCSRSVRAGARGRMTSRVSSTAAPWVMASADDMAAARVPAPMSPKSQPLTGSRLVSM